MIPQEGRGCEALAPEVFVLMTSNNNYGRYKGPSKDEERCLHTSFIITGLAHHRFLVHSEQPESIYIYVR